MSPHRPLSVAGLTEGLEFRAIGAVFAASVVVPWIVHFIPAAGGGTWGERLLPMFIAPLIGVAFFPLHVGLIPALLAPVANALITGLPSGNLILLLTVQLVVFTLLMDLALRKRPRMWFVAPLAYVTGNVCAAVLTMFLPFLAAGGDGFSLSIESLWQSAPGLLLLLLINVCISFRRSPVPA